MKLNLILAIVIGSSLVSFAFFGSFDSQSANCNECLELSINATKSYYTMGEPSTFVFEITNKTSETVSFLNALKATAGYLRVYISKDGSEFKEYHGARWGKDDARYNALTLKPNESITNTEIIFWNDKPVIEKLISPDVIKRSTEGKIMSYYAFPEAGIYNVKASYRLHLTDRKDPISIDSAPVRITIDAPTGDDLEIWNKVKNNGDIAYFIQEGDIRIPTYKSEERLKFQQFVEQIIAEYPGSFYTDSLRQGLSKFRENEEKRKAILEKIKRPE